MAGLIRSYAQFPFRIASAEGMRLHTEDGRALWDFYGGHAVALLGHCHPDVTAAVSEQAGRLGFYSNAVALGIREEAAEALCEWAPDGLDGVFFCNSGAEANENALKIAMLLTGRDRIAALTGGFHGRTLLALSATDGAKLRGPYESVLAPVVRIAPNDIVGVGRIDDGVAAVIVEPVLSMAGVIELDMAFLSPLRRRCDQTGALLIYDEVQTGMGRLGRPFAAGEGGVLPDMVTLAKGIANGFPMGAVLMTEAVASRLRIGDLGSTFGGGPMACAAMRAVLGVIERDDLVGRAAALGEWMRSCLQVGPVRGVLGRGCLVGLRVSGSAKDVQGRLLSAGFVTGTSADPAVLRLMPPLNAPDQAIDALAEALAAMEV